MAYTVQIVTVVLKLDFLQRMRTSHIREDGQVKYTNQQNKINDSYENFSGAKVNVF